MASRERILLVDDESVFLEAFRRTFEARNYEVMTAASKAQAEEFVRLKPDLVVLGTLTPAGQAFAVHQWLKGHPSHKNIPLLVVDATYEERPLKGWRKFEGMQLESDDYVTKPIEPSSLLPRVRMLLEQATKVIRVLVADDHTMVREGIEAVLALHKDIEVIGEAVNGQDACEKVLRLMPNVALMDIVMPVMSGLEATKRIVKECPQTRVLILTQYDEEENMLVARHAGASGFIPKKAAGGELLAGIRSVSEGSYYPERFAEVSDS